MIEWAPLYEALWKGRTFTNVEEAMENELNDKLTHPRLRKAPNQKFAEAIGRVCASTLTSDEKIKLIQAYISCLDKIEQTS